MIKGINIRRIFIVYDEVSLVFGAGIKPCLEISDRVARKFSYKLETEEDRKSAILDMYNNGCLPKYIYTELTACMNGKEREFNIKKDVEFLYTVAKKVYDTANIRIDNFIEKYIDFRFRYDSLERSWMSVNDAFTIQRKGKETDNKFYRIICHVSSEHIMDSDKKLFKYVYNMLDNHYDMITNGFPDGNDNIEIGCPWEFEEAFKMLSANDPLYWNMELCVSFQFK